ncbi:hypothetical protein [Streptomyces aidingensis]|uniref:Uncharacterized protein n=1 Tax=Streptomyces aidingensis TaxID=910347 RepID=A0A1I1S7Y8_9ACTN|nr:hypothetical protein [Streptomyces aidingensis]SFD42634.1 hypothetical protein SAMN05421773_11516 [Streptomyces aidingensis]
MDPHGPTAQRFPLVARFRPSCLPLPERVATLTELSRRAQREADQGLASAVFNQAALITSDLGLPDPARTMCLRHAAAYLHACPLPGMTAIRALEPVVNLARLHIRAGQGDHGRQHLLTLYEAVSSSTATDVEGVTIPAHLTPTAEDRQEVRAWLWRVVLADGTRTLTTAGRWAEALAHITAHRGLGNHMLDGRQVAIVAALVSGDVAAAEALLAATTPGAPWEQAVTHCLSVLCQQALDRTADEPLATLIEGYVRRAAEPGLTVFDIRLGLVILDATYAAHDRSARQVSDRLHHRTVIATDGYAARECLAHPRFRTLATEQQIRDCTDLLQRCALGFGVLPDDLGTELIRALATSESVIRASVTPLPGLNR